MAANKVTAVRTTLGRRSTAKDFRAARGAYRSGSFSLGQAAPKTARLSLVCAKQNPARIDQRLISRKLKRPNQARYLNIASNSDGGLSLDGSETAVDDVGDGVQSFICDMSFCCRAGGIEHSKPFRSRGRASAFWYPLDVGAGTAPLDMLALSPRKSL